MSEFDSYLNGYNDALTEAVEDGMSAIDSHLEMAYEDQNGNQDTDYYEDDFYIESFRDDNEG